MNIDSEQQRGTTARSSPASPEKAVAHGRSPVDERFDLWRSAHRSLRGRYRLALLIGVGGAISGAWLGSMLGQRLYCAVGLVRIACVLPQVLRETDQNRPMAMFDGLIEAQREKMSSRETIQAAMKEESWLQVSRGPRALSEEQFAAGLKVETRPRSDHLRVTFRNTDPALSAAAVRSIIAAYSQAFTREQDLAEGQRMDHLRGRRESLTDELAGLENEIGQTAQGHSGAELEPAYLAAAERVKKMRSALADVQYALAGGPDAAQAQRPAARLPGDMADDEILRAHAAEQARIEIALAEARSWGLGPSHPQILRLSALAQECRDLVAHYAGAYAQRRDAGAPGVPPPTLSDREASLRGLIQSAEDEMAQLATRRTQVKSLEERAASLRQSISETDSRLDALGTEASTGGRLTVVSEGDRPMTALLDNRAKTAALGGAAGLVLPIAAMALLGSRRRGYRFCDELAADLMDRVPFLAVLPEISRHSVLGAAAAHGVHDLRVRLQPPADSGPRTYLITSATAGEGKSSLAVAIGLSFAAAGFSTLLVDGDLTSRRLTRDFDAGESAGLMEAIAGGVPLIRRVRTGLSLLAAGASRPEDSCRLAPAATGRLLATLRERFDVVLIDSDPILTGLTASVIAPHVDGAVLTLARGQQQSRVRSTIRHFEMVGVALSAAAFNRAAPGDFRAAVDDQPPTTAAADRALPERLSRFGPLVGAMLRSLSLTRAEDLDVMPTEMTLTKPDETQQAAA